MEIKLLKPCPEREADLAVIARHVDREHELEMLRERVEFCDRCAISSTCRNKVFGEGPASARIVFVGEGPGAEEDATGRPFVGASGRLMDEMLKAAGLDRRRIFVTNTVRCRPHVGGQNRRPTPEEVQSCMEYTWEILELIRPEVVVCWGSVAAQAIISPAFAVTEQHGSWYEVRGMRVTAVFHPSHILRGNREGRKMVEEVLRQISKKQGKSPVAKTKAG